MANPFSRPLRPFPLLLALLGAAFCAFILLGGAELCSTSGCSLHQELTVFGYSLWWYGLGFFVLAALLVLVRQIRLASWLVGLGLAGDLALLAWMAATLPCANCLIVAFFIFATFVALTKPQPAPGCEPATPQEADPVLGAPAAKGFTRRPAWANLLIAAWLILASPGFFGLLHEVAGPWDVHEVGQRTMAQSTVTEGKLPRPYRPKVFVYFSPSCPSCRKTMSELLGDPSRNLAEYAFMPVGLNAADVYRVARLEDMLAEGKPFPVAYRAMYQMAEPEELGDESHGQAPSGDEPAPELSALRKTWLSYRLERNKIALYRRGAVSIPYIEIMGKPLSTLCPGSGIFN